MIDAIYKRMIVLEARSSGLEAENFVLHLALHETGQFQHYVLVVGDRVSVWMQPAGQNQFKLQGTVAKSQWDDFLGKVVER
jgi:ribosome maturation factor RimP